MLGMKYIRALQHQERLAAGSLTGFRLQGSANENGEVLEKLIEYGIKYERILPVTTDPSSALGKSWRDSLEVSKDAVRL